LPQSVARCLRETLSSDFDVIGYEVGPGVSESDLRAALVVLNEECKPAPPEKIGMWLAKLYALTKQRAEDQVTLDLATEAFMARLEKLPAAAVEAAMEAWPDKSKWFPSWQELKAEIETTDRATKVRKAIYDAIDRKHFKGRATEQKPTSEINAIPKSDFIRMLNENPSQFLKKAEN